jgi:hypothetical protein
MRRLPKYNTAYSSRTTTFDASSLRVVFGAIETRYKTWPQSPLSLSANEMTCSSALNPHGTTSAIREQRASNSLLLSYDVIGIA